MNDSKKISNYFRKPFNTASDKKEKPLRVINGNGTIILHDCSLDIDISIRLSDLLNTIKILKDRVDLLERTLSINLQEGEEQEPIEERYLGRMWRFKDNGTQLRLEVDTNQGLSIRDWQLKEEWNL